MTLNEKQGAAEWLRGIIGECGVSGTRSCTAIAEAFGIDCKHERTCRDCITKMMTAIADRIDAERALPADVEWPRFEDGGLVRIGDELEFEGKTMLVCDATFYADGWALWCDREDMSGRLYGSFGERVKRPAPEVLDADGVPIKVGDTVYCNGEDKQLMVSHIVDSTKVALFDGHFSYFRVKPSRLSHECPDSWEKLEEDARKTACNYAPAPCNEDGLVTCDGCPFQKSESCSNEMMIDLVERAKKLAKAGEVE